MHLRFHFSLSLSSERKGGLVAFNVMDAAQGIGFGVGDDAVDKTCIFRSLETKVK